MNEGKNETLLSDEELKRIGWDGETRSVCGRPMLWNPAYKVWICLSLKGCGKQRTQAENDLLKTINAKLRQLIDAFDRDARKIKEGLQLLTADFFTQVNRIKHETVRLLTKSKGDLE